MKNLLTLLILSLTQFVSAQDMVELSTDQAVENALKYNQQLKNAKLDIDYANAQVLEIASMGLPQINGNVGFSHNFKVATQVLPNFISPSVYAVLIQEGLVSGPAPSFPNIEAQFGVPYSLNAGLSLNQLVFDGTFFLGLKAASEFVNINELLASKSEIDVKQAVLKSYYMAIIADKNIAQLQKSLDNIQKLKAETKALYDEGFAEKLDNDRLILSASNVEISINNLKKQSELAKKVLLSSMGMDVNQDVKLTSTLPEFNATNFQMDYGSTVNPADRVEVSLIKQQQVLNELNLKRYKMGYVPNIYLNANYGYSTFAAKNNFGNLGSTWFPSAAYGLSLNIPIFDGLNKKAKMDQTKVDILKTENTLEQAINGIALEVNQARTSYINAYNNLTLQQSNIALSKEIYETTEIKFKEGLGSSFEMVNAERDLTEANTNYLNALYELNVAKLNLDKALGNL